MNKTNAAIVRTILLGTSCLSAFAAGTARAQPVGGNVALGTATITNRGANSTVIDQKTGKLVINWDSFNIAAGGTVQFRQPGSSAIALNRILGADPTSIYGNLLANGQVWIVNGNGVMFGQGSRINVGGLIATTSDLRDSDFAAGNYSFSGGTGASVVNDGTIRTRRGGYAVLSGASASNHGLIAADTGTVVIGGASAFTVDFQGDGLLRYAVTTPAMTATSGPTGASNSGTISAGRVVMTARAAADVQDAVVNNTGMISASSARVQNGEVILDGGDGDVNVAGTVQATGTASGTTGGDVTVTGRNITVADNAKIDVSGDAGGGTVKIGGDLHGAGPTPNAANTTVGAATIKADATRAGNGGTVIVWSNGTTNFSGVVSAKGGTTGGDGGLVETSGHTLNVTASATVNTLAPRGKTGTWLLDPTDVDITSSGGSDITGSSITPTAIIGALGTTDVEITASNNITVDSAVEYDGDHRLSLLAQNNIIVNANIQNAGSGAVDLIAGWNGTQTGPAHFTDTDVFGVGGAYNHSNVSFSFAAVGSKGGTTTVAGYNINLVSQSNGAFSQIGYRGNGGGAINVDASHNVSLFAGEGTDALAMIGNGDKLGSVTGAVTGNISIAAANDLTMQVYTGGTLWIGNATTGTESGNLTLASTTVSDISCCGFEGQGSIEPMIATDLVGGDVTWESYGDMYLESPITYSSAHTLSLLAMGDLYVAADVQNAGTGAINAIAGWDGTTTDPSKFTSDGVYGNDNGSNNHGSVFITSDDDLDPGDSSEADSEPYEVHSVAIGSAGGTTTVAGSYVGVLGYYAPSQIGYLGGGGGDIVVRTLGDTVVDGSWGYNAVIGNGDFNGGTVGDVTGNIDVRTGGGFELDGNEELGSTAWIGNTAGEEFSETGNVTLISNGGAANGVDFSANIESDLAGGDFTLGDTYGLLETGALQYTSAHDLTLLSVGDLVLTNSIINDGSGAITLVAGWDGSTLDPTALRQAGAFGVDGDGQVVIGGGTADGDVFVGTKGGQLTVLAGELDLSAENGNAQLGYHGAGGGDISVTTLGDVDLFGGDPQHSGFAAMIGNGALDGSVDGGVGGNIFLSVGGTLTLATATSWCPDGANNSSTVFIGNATGPDGGLSGNLVLLSAGIDDDSDANVGGFGAILAADLANGDVTVGNTDSEGSVGIFDDILYSSSHSLTLLSTGNIDVQADIENSGSGAITLVAGWDGVYDPERIGVPDTFGRNFGAITIGGGEGAHDSGVGTAHGDLRLYTSDLTLDGGSGIAQLGYHGAGGGDISVIANGDLTITAGDSYAMIGNGSLGGDVTGNVAGNIFVRVEFGDTELHNSETARAWLGNATGGAGKASGDVTVITDLGGVPTDVLATDLGTSTDTGGNVFLGYTDPNDGRVSFGGMSYNSPHAFTIASPTDLLIDGSIQNAGTGEVVMVAGWDEQTIGASAALLAAHAYGLHGATLTIAGDDVAAGSAAGLTTALGHDIVLAGGEGYAQLGWHGTGGGDIHVVADGNVTLSGDGDATKFAQIGNGSVFGTDTMTGDVTVSAASIQGSGFASIVADDLSLTTGAGGIGNSDAALQIAVHSLTLQTSGASAYLSTPHSLSFASANLAGGNLTLAAGGAISQTGAIHSGNLNVSTMIGGITLTDTGNTFGGLTVSTQGSDNASFAHSSLLNVASANVGGMLSLVAGTSVTQSGAIHAASLSATANNGTVVLTNAGNAFSGLAVSTNGGNDASIVDTTGFGLQTSNVGGTLTFTAGGTVTQPGTLHSAGLAASTTAGDIVLGDAANAVSGTVTFHSAGAAYFNDTLSIAIGPSTAGGLLTLVSGGSVSQTGTIHASDLAATAKGGDVVLNDAANTFATLRVSATGNAGLTDASAVTVDGATVGGALTLVDAASIGQSGAIHAATLNATANSGGIVLNDSGNSFATLSLSTTGANSASVTDSTGVTLAGATVGGTLTLSAGGAVGQSAALHSAGLSVSTSTGDIVLANAANAVTGTESFHTPGAASFTDTASLNLGATNVGGLLTLVSGGGIGQSGAIQAGGLNAAANGGAIVLTDTGNAFSTLILGTVAGSNATVTDSTAVAVGGATVAGAFTLSAGGAVTQTGAINSGSLNVSTTSGDITLTNAGNSFATLSLSTAGTNDASVTDSTGVTLAASNVGGKLTLSAGGAIGQSGALHSAGLNVSATSGAIALTNTANAVSGLVQFNTPGAASLYDTLGVAVGASGIGGDFTLLSKGNVGFVGSVQSTTGAIVVVAGWDGTTVDATQFGTSGVYGNGGGSVTIGGAGATGNVGVGSKTGATTVYASDLNILGTNGGAQLGYHGAGGGAIKVVALHNVNITAGAGGALLGNGSLGNDVSGTVTGDIDVRLGGTLSLNGSANGSAWIGNTASAGSETGNLILIANDESDTSGAEFGKMIVSALGGGDVTVGFTGTGDEGPGKNYSYNSSHTFNLLSAGNLVFAGSIQNAGSGAINLVAGWDGHTLAPASFGQSGVYGNNGKGVTIGGSGATGGVAVGSAGGTTSVYGASLLLSALNGYAQLGFNGHGAGAILVNTTGAVTLTGGAAAGDFAQIGNGGLKTSGNNSGDITITAGGDIVLGSGAGAEAYAQIGHGGAESNTGASGYSNTGAIGLNAANLTMTAGSGAAAYVQVGQGGYKAGLNLAGGQAVNSGKITVTVAHMVSLTGNGVDAYAQIGNGGSQSNLNAAAAAGGTDSGDIVVTAPNGSSGGVVLTSGAGANAYSQIGNGGYAVNSGPTTTVANFTVTGNVSVTDLALTGGGDNGYSQIGNGDASHNASGNISGDILIDANGAITYTAGTGIHSQATIGNFTGKGTVSGTLTGATPPPEFGNDPGTIGVIVTSIANNKPNGNNPITTIATTVVIGEEQNGGASSLAAHIENNTPPGPLAALEGNGGETSGPNTSDSATVVIADSLDGAKKTGTTQTILAGMLSQQNPAAANRTIHAVPSADQDFSSWGNEALWQ